MKLPFKFWQCLNSIELERVKNQIGISNKFPHTIWLTTLIHNLKQKGNKNPIILKNPPLTLEGLMTTQSSLVTSYS